MHDKLKNATPLNPAANERGPIWNSIERASIKEVQSAASKRFLPNQMEYVRNTSPFYKDKLAGVAFKRSFSWLDCLTQLPLTEKSEIIEDQINYPPFGRNLCISKADIVRIHKTSGTTGRPLLLGFTAEDIRQTVEAGARCFWAAGLRPSHTVIHCLNYRMWAGGYTDHQSLEATGAAVVPYGVGESRSLIENILLLKPDAIHCTPSYLSKLESLMQDHFDISPKDLGLSLGLFGGEGGLEDNHFRNDIEKVWGFSAINANYGMSDVLSMFGSECSEKRGLHFMGQGIILAEILESISLEALPIEEGVVGELVLTNFVKKAQPLIRYRTRDVIEILGTDVCSCGRQGFRFRVVGRSDDMIVVKGINVFPGAIASVINKNLDLLTGEYQICVDSVNPVKKLLIKAELRKMYSDHSYLSSRIANEITIGVGVKPEIELVAPSTLPKVDGKSKRIQRIL